MANNISPPRQNLYETDIQLHPWAPSNIPVYEGEIPSLLVGSASLIVFCFYIGLCLSILIPKIQNTEYENFQLSVLQSLTNVLFMFGIMVIIYEKTQDEHILTAAIIGIIAVCAQISFQKYFYNTASMTRIIMGVITKIFLAFYALVLHAYYWISIKRLFYVPTPETISEKFISLFLIYIIPIAVALLYRRKDPKYSAALPYKFIAGSILIMALCLLLPIIDVLVAKHDAG